MHLSFTNPGNPNQDFLKASAKFLCKEKPDLVIAGFAYASLAGVNRLLADLNCAEWENARKSFVVSGSQGITEPAAIRALMAQPNIDVRMAVPGRRLEKKALFSHPLFHAKTIFFENTKSKKFLIFVSSANLTGGAIGFTPKNFECGAVIFSSRSNSMQSELRKFDNWWSEVWDASLVMNAGRLRKYASYRTDFFTRNPDTLHFTEPSSDIRNATHFWIHVGAASGVQRHQVEFPQLLASFFGKPMQFKVDLDLSHGPHGMDCASIEPQNNIIRSEYLATGYAHHFQGRIPNSE